MSPEQLPLHWSEVGSVTTFINIPSPLILSTLLRSLELVTVLVPTYISLLSLYLRLEMTSLVAVLFSLSDHISDLPVLAGIEFSSIPTIKLL